MKPFFQSAILGWCLIIGSLLIMDNLLFHLFYTQGNTFEYSILVFLFILLFIGVFLVYLEWIDNKKYYRAINKEENIKRNFKVRILLFIAPSIIIFNDFIISFISYQGDLGGVEPICCILLFYFGCIFLSIYLIIRAYSIRDDKNYRNTVHIDKGWSIFIIGIIFTVFMIFVIYQGLSSDGDGIDEIPSEICIILIIPISISVISGLLLWKKKR